jgi:hypothetical protein
MKKLSQIIKNTISGKTNIKMDRRYMVVIDRLKLSVSIFIIYAIFTFLHIGCPIRFVTGISCPGCGMTRAVLSVLHFNFKDAFYYHPLFFLAPVMYGLFLFDAFIKPSISKAIWSIIILLFLLTYAFRVFIVPSDVVTIDISKGIMLKLIHKILWEVSYD